MNQTICPHCGNDYSQAPTATQIPDKDFEVRTFISPYNFTFQYLLPIILIYYDNEWNRHEILGNCLSETIEPGMNIRGTQLDPIKRLSVRVDKRQPGFPSTVRAVRIHLQAL